MTNISESSSLQQDLRRTTRLLFVCTAAWVATTAVAAFGPSSLWAYSVSESQVAILVNVVAGILMLFAFYKHLLSMDELQRKTHLEAMALSLGVTMIFTVAYVSVETANLLANARPSNMLFVMGITYFGAVVVLWLKRTTE